MPIKNDTATPYAGTSGWSGSDASRENAEAADASGKTRDRQQGVLRALTEAGPRGMIWREISEQTGWHHGQVTGPLSVLHKDGTIARLADKRDRCSVYVLPEHVQDRQTSPYGRRKRPKTEEEQTVEEMQAELEDLRKKIAKVEDRIRPQWRSYSYTRDRLIEDLQRDLL